VSVVMEDIAGEENLSQNSKDDSSEIVDDLEEPDQRMRIRPSEITAINDLSYATSDEDSLQTENLTKL